MPSPAQVIPSPGHPSPGDPSPGSALPVPVGNSVPTEQDPQPREAQQQLRCHRGATEVPSAPQERCGAGAAPGHMELFPTLAEASVKSLLKPQVRDCFSCPSGRAVPSPHPRLHTGVLMSTNCSGGGTPGTE